MKNTPITVTVHYSAQPGREAAAHAELTALIAQVQAHETACHGITLHRRHDDPGQLLLIERWSSQADYEGDHMQTAHLREFIARAPAFLAGPPTITIWS